MLPIDKLHFWKGKISLFFFVCCCHNWALCQLPKSEFFFTEWSLVYAQTEGRGKLLNLDNCAAVSRGILRTGPWVEFGKIFCGKLWALLMTSDQW